jgi:hypothetical protein
MIFTVHDFWLGLRFTLSALALVLFVYLRFWSAESARAGSWKAGHQRLWKKPKRWQLVLFCILWGIILIAFLVAAILNLK